MFKTKTIARMLAATSLLAMTALAHAQSMDRVYVIDQRGEVARSGTGLCWRTGFWTPAAAANDPAGCACDKDLLPKEKCEPKPAAAAAAPVAAKPITIAAKELFDYDKATLKPEGKAEVDKLVTEMKKYGKDTVEIEGHTCDIGDEKYNMGLGQRRADAVKKYMVESGIAEARIKTVSYGETRPDPNYPNTSAANRKMNRRAVFNVSLVD